MPLAVFRADAGGRIGAGHVMRCIALAEAFEAAGWSVAFAGTAETFATIDPIQKVPGERLVLTVGEMEEPDALRAYWPHGADVLVVDHYGRARNFEWQCRPWARRIAAIDDLADREHDAEVVVDASASSPEPYSNLVPQGCQVLTGPRYAIVHSRFEAVRDVALARRGKPRADCILISFGQNDARNTTGDALAALDAVGFGGTVHMVMGSSAPHLETLRAGLRGDRHLHVDASDMQMMMADADLAIGGAGATAWERCFLALPSVLVLLADNQKGNVEIVAGAGAGIDAGPVDSGLRGRLGAILRGLIQDGERLSTMAACGAALVDGSGKQRIVRAVTGS